MTDNNAAIAAAEARRKEITGETQRMRIWNAVSKTDPSHTKKVTFGRTFTSIDAHWQIQQATKQFGPVGEGWRYEVQHSIERLADTMILAVADVTIQYHTGTTDILWSSYGPIRGTCEIYSPDKSGKMRVDEDAPKKAMTDALTKGLSHLGFSADVFLGLFDDNRYVQKVEREFKDADKADIERLSPKNAPRDGEGELLSTYASDVAKKAKDWADAAISSINLGKTEDAIAWARAAGEVPKGKKKSPLGWLEDNAPDQFVRVNTAYTNVVGEGLR